MSVRLPKSTVPPLHIFVATLLALVLVGCTDGDGVPADSPDAGISDGLCEVGTLGCECASGGVCGTDMRGNALVCQGDLCVPADCEAGETGCVCLGGATCIAAGDSCDDGVCKSTDCTAGTLHCDCLVGTCNAGLHCDTALGGGTCIDGTGYPGGACLENRLCYGKNRCDAELSVCVFCEAGSQACVARDGGLCNPGLVLHAGRCLSPMDVPPAEEDRTCRMRCREAYVSGVEYRACVDGFIEGCVGGLECVDGSCVVPGEDPPTCHADTDCPDFQRCFGNGRCYSECDGDTDCLDGYSCFRHSCRVPCMAANAASPECPTGMHCDTRDGTAGVCMPLPEPGETESSAVRATFEPTPSVVGFDATSSVARVRLVVESDVAEVLEIRKVTQHVYDAAGDEVIDPLGTSSPLHFVTVGAPGAVPATDGSLRITAPARCGDECPLLTITATGAPNAAGWARWEGELEVRHATLGERRIRLGYQGSADGRWTGSMYYFATFPEENVAEWRARDGQPGTGLWDTDDVGNALIQAWGTYRLGRMTGGVDALRAVLDATATESWRWSSVSGLCEETFGADDGTRYPGACFLFDDGRNGTLPREYVDDVTETPIPTGATEYPIALNVRTTTGAGGLPELRGVIDSDVALHYPGDPRVQIAFERSPFAPNVCNEDGNARDCVVYLDAFAADVRVGARMPTNALGRCAPTFTAASFPWLLPDFLGDSDGSVVDECLDHRAPFPRGTAGNTNLARANPFRDGRAIRRELRLMDGALINQRTLIVLFEERFTSSVHVDAFSAFGFMVLEQSDDLVEDEVFQEAAEAAALADNTSPDPGAATGPTCDPDLLADVFGEGFALPDSIDAPEDRADVEDVIEVMLTGRVGASGVEEYTVANGLRDNVHYLCVDTGLIDGGPDAAAPKHCPAVSRVQYFFLPDPYNASVNLRALDCQKDADPTDADYRGTCGNRVNEWATSLPGFVRDPLWRCSDPTVVYCSDDPADLRAGKTFYTATEAAFLPLAPMIQEAFRYKTRFISGTNRSVGFAPRACTGSGSLTPYCYDPIAIEEILLRIDCLLAVYEQHGVHHQSDGSFDALRAFLSSSLSFDVALGEYSEDDGLLEDGFERLYAELLIMLGDEAFTAALSSRFDLEANQSGSFLGSEFEENGVDLSGIAGAEMRSLYRAVQYYDLATDRFYQRVAPVVRAAIDEGDVGASGDAIVTQGLVTRYLERLIGASTKRATTWSEIALRYQSLNRRDLAEAVLARAYTSTFLESVVLSRLMLGVAELQTTERDQVVAEIEQAQRRYQVALREMREVLTAVQDDVDIFGLTADYVPFPAVDDTDFRYSNAFEAVLGIARLRMETARRFEDDAVFASREFETDSEAFQSELVQIARGYEDRLQQLCGGFRGHDGRVYPAITKYARLSDATSLMASSPCGRVANGEIHERIAQLTLLDDERLRIETRAHHVQEEYDDEVSRAEMQCTRIRDFITDWRTKDGQRINVEATINGMRTAVSAIDRTFNTVAMVGAATDPISKLAVGGAALSVLGASSLEIAIAAKQTELMNIEQGLRSLEMEQECASLTIDSAFRLKAIARSGTEVQLEALQLAHRVELVFSEIDRLYLEAQRLEEQQRDAEQLAIDVQAARNDPNIRVYRNSAILNADRSFDRALEHAYRATRMFEYYTSQTYAGRDELYLIRMVARGPYNLVSYLDDLEDEYEAFRVEYRTRAHRVRRISLLNDIFRIPYQDEGGELDDDDRFALMRERLLDPSRIDPNGHRVVEFRTFESQTAPCTFNHQIDYVEIDLVGQNLGDEFANILLWQDGTGVIEPVSGDPDYYRLPPALVVAQPHFNNSQRFDPAIYRRYELRERPLVNTSWKLVFDQHDDPDNQDISIDGLKDIHIYVHYTDFTDPGACR